MHKLVYGDFNGVTRVIALMAMKCKQLWSDVIVISIASTKH